MHVVYNDHSSAQHPVLAKHAVREQEGKTKPMLAA